MYRIAFAVLLSTAAFAQTNRPPAPKPAAKEPAEKPPAEVDQALRTRVTEFYTLMVTRQFRKAEDWIAEDTKDYYYASTKPEIAKFELISVEFSDHFTHAKAVVKCSEPLIVPGFPPGEITLNIPTLWRLESGNWVIYEDMSKLKNPAGLRSTVQTAVSQAAGLVPPSATPPPPASPATPPVPMVPMKDGIFVVGNIQLDRTEVKLAAGKSEQVKIFNGGDGVFSLQQGYPLKDIQGKFDRVNIGSGQTAILTLTAGPEPKGGIFMVVLQPMGQTIGIKVDVQ